MHKIIFTTAVFLLLFVVENHSTPAQAQEDLNHSHACLEPGHSSQVAERAASYMDSERGEGTMVVAQGGPSNQAQYCPSGFMGDAIRNNRDDADFTFNFSASCPEGWPSETPGSCIDIQYSVTEPEEGEVDTQDWAGVYWVAPCNNNGNHLEGGQDVSTAETLTFWAASLTEDVWVEFAVGGFEPERRAGDNCAKMYPEGANAEGRVLVTQEPQQFTVDLSACAEEDRVRLVGGFGFAIDAFEEQGQQRHYFNHHLVLDDIVFHGLEDQPRFPPSHKTRPLTRESGFRQVTDRLSIYTDNECGSAISCEEDPEASAEQAAWCSYPSGWFGDIQGLTVQTDASGAEGCESGSCMLVQYQPTVWGPGFVGVYMEVTPQHWGTRTGVWDLTDATTLRFDIKRKSGNPRKCFFTGGVTEGSYPGSEAKWAYDLERFDFEDKCQQAEGNISHINFETIEIDLSETDMSQVITPFAWVFRQPDCTGSKGCEILIDNIEVLFDEPTEIVSTVQAPDSFVDGQIHSYDVALAILSLIERNPELAKTLGQTLHEAAQNDPWNPGQLRDVYHANPLLNLAEEGGNDFVSRPWGGEGTNSFVGNQAWPLIAILRLAEKSCEQNEPAPELLEFARSLGEFIAQEHATTGFGGFYGGTEGPGNYPTYWKATEHNIDAYVAFTLLDQWFPGFGYGELALSAFDFVQRMWDGDHFSTGTALVESCGRFDRDCIEVEDERCRIVNPKRLPTCGEKINRTPFPVDAQLWAIQAGIPDGGQTRRAMDWVMERCVQKNPDGQFGVGFDCPEEKDGKIWMEGTAQLVVTLRDLQQERHLCPFMQTLQWAQENLGEDGGIVAADQECLSTGFHWNYFQREHVGATAWTLMAMDGVNPLRTDTEVCDMGCEPSNEGIEECDGIDNDCDGQIDEEIVGIGEACGMDMNECNPGRIACARGELICEGATEAFTELCDGIDNDCDGQIDEDARLRDGSCRSLAFDFNERLHMSQIQEAPTLGILSRPVSDIAVYPGCNGIEWSPNRELVMTPVANGLGVLTANKLEKLQWVSSNTQNHFRHEVSAIWIDNERFAVSSHHSQRGLIFTGDQSGLEQRCSITWDNLPHSLALAPDGSLDFIHHSWRSTARIRSGLNVTVHEGNSCINGTEQLGALFWTPVNECTYMQHFDWGRVLKKTDSRSGTSQVVVYAYGNEMQPIVRWQANTRISTIEVSRDGLTLAVAHGNQVGLLDLREKVGDIISIGQYPEPITAVSWSPAGRIAVRHAEGIDIYDPELDESYRIIEGPMSGRDIAWR